MANKKFFMGLGKATLLLLVFGLVLTGCGGKKYKIAELQTALEQKSANTEGNPYSITLAAVNITENLKEINAIVESAGRYVDLDLSFCSATNNTIAGAKEDEEPSDSDMNLIRDNRYIKGIILPKSLTGIEDEAFTSCKSLASVTIPGSVTSIVKRAFVGCDGLTSFTVAKSNTAYASVDGVLFNKDKTTLIQFPKSKSGNYTIPSSVTSISGGAFSGCGSLMSVTIPDSVTSIGHTAFFRCNNLTSVTIPGSVTGIGNYAFMLCNSLTSVTFGEGSNIANFNSSIFGDGEVLVEAYIAGKAGTYIRNGSDWTKQ
jgi:hypothetical protein